MTQHHPKQNAKERLVTHIMTRLDAPDAPCAYTTESMIGLLRVLADTALELSPITLLRTPASVVSTLAIIVESGVNGGDEDDTDHLLYDRIQRQAHEELAGLEQETLSSKAPNRIDVARCFWRRLMWTR